MGSSRHSVMARSPAPPSLILEFPTESATSCRSPTVSSSDARSTVPTRRTAAGRIFRSRSAPTPLTARLVAPSSSRTLLRCRISWACRRMLTVGGAGSITSQEEATSHILPIRLWLLSSKVLFILVLSARALLIRKRSSWLHW
jgi:hypothetical protein